MHFINASCNNENISFCVKDTSNASYTKIKYMNK